MFCSSFGDHAASNYKSQRNSVWMVCCSDGTFLPSLWISPHPTSWWAGILDVGDNRWCWLPTVAVLCHSKSLVATLVSHEANTSFGLSSLLSGYSGKRVWLAASIGWGFTCLGWGNFGCGCSVPGCRCLVFYELKPGFFSLVFNLSVYVFVSIHLM